ncbi:lysozyme inhibitor LprI family protein [Ramlibacter albus]|uniref:DUF1311 domain-containing protein n=1 Tax=Ramlibacter albus TaxID=2079448 RepID=A0A923S3J1_9BURK|nr:hypothetical protein [Ramlibacter albus]MBC5766476.1 hypothetical protein [Ramlibacter albus]
MDTRWRQGAIFAAGLAAGGLIAAAVFTQSREDVAAVEPARAPAVKAAAPAPKVAAQSTAACSFEPVVAKAGPRDGQLAWTEPGASKTKADVGVALVQGKEAMAAGRDRDAEVSFLSACRIAAQATPAGSQERADSMYQLARHYTTLAQERPANRAELLKRAKPLYEDSLRIYLARFGDGHEKSRFAAEGLASLRQEVAQSTVRPPARAPTPPAVAPRPEPQPVPPPTQAMGAAREPDKVVQPQPSFDCEKARSTPEHLICNDAELAQLDRELGAIYKRAKNAASDPEAFQRVSDREWRRRESECGDRDCLLRWYAQRKRQLQEQLEHGAGEQVTIRMTIPQ